MAKNPSIPSKMDADTRKVVLHAETIDHAMRENPHGHGTVSNHMWSSLVRAKWAIARNEQVLLSKKS